MPAIFFLTLKHKTVTIFWLGRASHVSRVSFCLLPSRVSFFPLPPPVRFCPLPPTVSFFPLPPRCSRPLFAFPGLFKESSTSTNGIPMMHKMSDLKLPPHPKLKKGLAKVLRKCIRSPPRGHQARTPRYFSEVDFPR